MYKFSILFGKPSDTMEIKATKYKIKNNCLCLSLQNKKYMVINMSKIEMFTMEEVK